MFGRPSRRFFGIFHPRTTAAQSGAVLVCNPFGQEAIRAHRMFRVLAERLARAGFDCLRFDYFGNGDSAGADEDGDLKGWVEDVRIAHGELHRRTQSSRLAWVGVRLGGSIAVLAVPDSAGGRPRLVLWDPIVEGSGYLDVLRLKHVESLENAYDLPDASWRKRLAEDPGAFLNEAIGFGISAALRRQLEQLSRSRLSLPTDLELHIVARPDDDSANAWLLDLKTDGTRVHHWPLSHRFDWTAPEAMNTTLVPGPALNRIVASISD